MNLAHKKSDHAWSVEEYLHYNDIDYIGRYCFSDKNTYFYTREQVSVHQVWENTNDEYSYYFDDYVMLMIEED